MHWFSTQTGAITPAPANHQPQTPNQPPPTNTTHHHHTTTTTATLQLFLLPSSSLCHSTRNLPRSTKARDTVIISLAFENRPRVSDPCHFLVPPKTEPAFRSPFPPRPQRSGLLPQTTHAASAAAPRPTARPHDHTDRSPASSRRAHPLSPSAMSEPNTQPQASDASQVSLSQRRTRPPGTDSY